MDNRNNVKKMNRVIYTQSNYRSPKVNPFTGNLTQKDALSKWVQNDGVFNRTVDNYTNSLTRNINSEMRENRNNTFISPTRGKNVLSFNFSRMVNSPQKIDPPRKSEIDREAAQALVEKAEINYTKIQRVVETWINETLKEAEYMDIPNIILKPQNKLPINRYGIDRLTLSNECLEGDVIDRVYRTLFVYSTGFYEVIKKILDN